MRHIKGKSTSLGALSTALVNNTESNFALHLFAQDVSFRYLQLVDKSSLVTLP